MKLHKVPTFEQWVEGGLCGYLGNDVEIQDGVELLGWYREYTGINLKGISQVQQDPDRVPLPAGAYTVQGNDTEYVLLKLEDGTEQHAYVVKKYDFEEAKGRIKN